MKRVFILLILLLVLALALGSAMFSVDESEHAIITQFGEPIHVIKEAGLYWKKPTPLQTVTFLNKRLMVYDPSPVELLTLDKKNILIDSFMLWKIDDPLLFLKSVKDPQGAESRLSDILSSQMGAVLGKHPLSSLLSVLPGEMKVEALMKEVTQECARLAKRDYGITVIDVRIKRQNFPSQNKQSVFERMQAERMRIAKKFRSEGEEEALKIQANTDRERRRILSEAYKEAQIIRGEGDAKSTAIYAKAFGQDPQFYKFLRTLEAYQKILNEKTTIVLPSDSKLLRLLNDGPDSSSQSLSGSH